MANQQFGDDGQKVKCTYGPCEGHAEGGILDDRMRPFHKFCASKALGSYDSANLELIAFLIGIAGGCFLSVLCYFLWPT